jgi:hypothetical protein
MKRLLFVLFLTISVLGLNAQETVKDFEKIGVEKFKAKDYAGSIEAFVKALDLNTVAGTEDGALYFKACQAALKAENYEKLAIYADKTIELNYIDKGSKTYLYSAIAYKELGNAEKEEAALKSGLAKYADDADLKAKLATRILKNGNEHYDKAVEFQKLANENMKVQAKFDEFVAKAKEEFILAKPFFEESYKLNPTFEATQTLLKAVYNNLQTPDAERLVK